MTVEIPELEQLPILIKKIEDLEKTVKQQQQREIPEWCNSKDCWELKGGCAYNTYITNRFYQIKGGIPDAKVGGRAVWNRQSVLEWLSITDDQLEDYHNKYKTGAKRR